MRAMRAGSSGLVPTDERFEMWKRFAKVLRCPLCAESLRLYVFEERRVVLDPAYRAQAQARGIEDNDFDAYVEAGLLSCAHCDVSFPVFMGLPVLLPYETRLHDEFRRELKPALSALGREVRFPHQEPVAGERFVLSSFSTEWLNYEFDGVIWEMDYADHERRFLTEMGLFRPEPGAGSFLEVGCGIGLTTEMAQRNFGVEAVGVDLSLASLRASRRFESNPFLHFVQASVFQLPFAPASFASVYSRGVLHHTYSTAEAFASLARYCSAGGTTYLWVYGPKSIDDNFMRRFLYVGERGVRWWLRGRADGPTAKVVLYPWACAYLVFNRLRRASDPTIQPYNFRRALHAARDRFTPEFAHRHDAPEVTAWFRRAGFQDIEVVDWRSMPSADHDDYRRNTGIRGRKARADRVRPAPEALSGGAAVAAN